MLLDARSTVGRGVSPVGSSRQRLRGWVALPEDPLHGLQLQLDDDRVPLRDGSEDLEAEDGEPSRCRMCDHLDDRAGDRGLGARCLWSETWSLHGYLLGLFG